MIANRAPFTPAPRDIAEPRSTPSLVSSGARCGCRSETAPAEDSCRRAPALRGACGSSRGPIRRRPVWARRPSSSSSTARASAEQRRTGLWSDSSTDHYRECVRERSRRSLGCDRPHV